MILLGIVYKQIPKPTISNQKPSCNTPVINNRNAEILFSGG